MTTISKFYLHDAATPNTGTMPGSGDAFVTTSDATGDATGARTARAANDTIGTLQTSSVITATANQVSQDWGHRRFVSAPLAATTFTNADGNWTFSFAAAESNTSHNGAFSGHVYPWRPSTGLRVGTATVSILSSVPSATATTAYSTTGTWTLTQAILDGDILVFEISDNFTQGMSTAYTSTFFYDGTTEASVTSCASFLTPPSALTLYVPPPGLPFYFDPIPFVSPGRI